MKIKEIFRLFAKIGNWFRTNWKKIVIKIDKNIVIGKTFIYESGCWNCGSPIRSVGTNRGFKGWLGTKWLKWFGNEKCPRPDCNYFICNKCGKCLCESPVYGPKKGTEPFYKIEKKWVREDTQTKEI